MENELISLRELQLIELNVLVRMRDMLEALGLKYYLCGGTLLGTIRHKGFIPWDNDIDVAMPRADFDAFIEHIKAGGLPEGLAAYYPGMKGYQYPFLKLCDDRTVLYECRFKGNSLPIGVFIDVFPYDKMPADERKRRRLIKRMRFLRKLSMLKSGDSVRRDKPLKEHLKAALLRVPAHVFSCFGLVNYPLLMNRIARKANIEGSYRLGNFVWGFYYRDHFDPSAFEKPILAEFEGEQFYIPNGYDEYLTIFYGDYMQLPPIEMRKSHSVEAYWKRKEPTCG